MNTLSTSIILNGLKFYSYHGVLPQENKVGAEYTVNIVIHTDFHTASVNDDLLATINYAEVYEITKGEMQISSKLLENVVYRISQKLFETFHSIDKIEIELFKENPPMGADCQNIGVKAVYTR